MRDVNYNLANFWTPEIIDNYCNSMRSLFRPVSASLIHNYFKENVSKESKILEIGSGLGELVNLLGGHNILQSDIGVDIAKKNKLRHPSSDIVNANLYSLPFKENSFDVVAGYLVLDTIPDLYSALTNVHNVLKEGGSLVHFLDMSPWKRLFFEEFKDKDQILFPLYEEARDKSYNLAIGFQIVNGSNLVPLLDYFSSRVKRDFSDINNDQFNGFLDWFKDYVVNSESNFMDYYEDKDSSPLLAYTSDVVKDSGLSSRVIKWNEHFRSKLKTSLERVGFKDIEEIYDSDFYVLNRDQIVPNVSNENLNNFNYVHNYCGDIFYLNSNKEDARISSLENEIEVQSTMYIISAKK